jgi:hypothetical protein
VTRGGARQMLELLDMADNQLIYVHPDIGKLRRPRPPPPRARRIT